MAEEKLVKRFVLAEKNKDTGNPGFLVKTNSAGEPSAYSEEEVKSLFAAKDKRLAPLFSGEARIFSIVDLVLEVKF